MWRRLCTMIGGLLPIAGLLGALRSNHEEALAVSARVAQWSRQKGSGLNFKEGALAPAPRARVRRLARCDGRRCRPPDGRRRAPGMMVQRPRSFPSFVGLNPISTSSPTLMVGVERLPSAISSSRASRSTETSLATNGTPLRDRNSIAAWQGRQPGW